MSGTAASNNQDNKRQEQPAAAAASPNQPPAASPATTNLRPREYNPRWLGYSLIGLGSLVNLSSVSSISPGYQTHGTSHPALVFGILTFLLCVIILGLDRSQLFIETFNYTKAWDGKLEGYTLLMLTILWIVAVGVMTQVGGIGYSTLNVYFSSWLTLFAVIYTLNKWSESKDILSIAELTSISATLKSWYMLFLSSIVVFGTCVNILAVVSSPSSSVVSPSNNLGDAVYGCIIAFVSTILSLAMIFVHYNFIEFCNQGGWIEMALCVVLVLLWIMAVALITQSGGVGATIVGTNYDLLYQVYQQLEAEASPASPPPYTSFSQVQQANCTLELTSFNAEGLFQVVRTPCGNAIDHSAPGSNLYLFTWLALASSVNIGLRWKAQQALQFAQARNKAAMDQAHLEDNDDDDDNDDDSIIDEDDFEDAAER